MKLKIGIITINDFSYAYNLGGQLQSYALIVFLKKFSYKPKMIRSYHYPLSSERYGLFYDLYELTKYKFKLKYWKLKKNKIKNRNIKERIIVFDKFNSKKIPKDIMLIHKGTNYKRLNKRYDYVIAGSDQVWNPNFFGDMYVQFLAFAASEKKVAYAPSIGVSELTDDQQAMFKKYLQDFRVLSCREKAGADILKEITGQEVPVVLDPAFLLTREEWIEIEQKPKFFKTEKYILLYYLGEITEEYQSAINKFEKELNCKTININDEKSVYYACGPAEFVYLIRNAEIILTDSFHACVFSTLFEKPFLVFDRRDNVKSMNSRMDNLFDMLDLHDHKYTGLQNLSQIMHPNYTHTRELLEIEREKSKNFLLNALKRN